MCQIMEKFNNCLDPPPHSNNNVGYFEFGKNWKYDDLDFRFRYISEPNILNKLNIEKYRHHNHKK